MKLDHIAVLCEDLEAGASHVETALGVKLSPGGQHRRFGTHNRLLRLAGGLYLEVIARDPAQRHAGPGWFGLDAFRGPPRIGNWICAVDDLDAALEAAPPSAGAAVDLERGDLHWRIAVPGDGSLPLGGQFPTLITWGAGVTHPAASLPASGLALSRLIVRGPDIAGLGLSVDGAGLVFEPAAEVSFEAIFDGPDGQRRLT